VGYLDGLLGGDRPRQVTIGRTWGRSVLTAVLPDLPMCVARQPYAIRDSNPEPAEKGEGLAGDLPDVP